MDIFEIRRQHLIKLKDERCGGKIITLAEKIDTSQSYVSRMLYEEGKNGKKNISDKMVSKIINSFNLPNGWLDGVTSAVSNIVESTSQPSYTGSFPLISSVQAGTWTEACEPYNLKDSEMLATTERAGTSSFWLTVEGDSMTAPTGSSLSFPAGVRVLVDPSREPRNGSYIVAKLTDVNEATFKRLVIDAGQKYLQPLNPSFQTMPINGNCRIVGVVVDAKINLNL